MRTEKKETASSVIADVMHNLSDEVRYTVTSYFAPIRAVVRELRNDVASDDRQESDKKLPRD